MIEHAKPRRKLNNGDPSRKVHSVILVWAGLSGSINQFQPIPLFALPVHSIPQSPSSLLSSSRQWRGGHSPPPVLSPTPHSPRRFGVVDPGTSGAERPEGMPLPEAQSTLVGLLRLIWPTDYNSEITTPPGCLFAFHLLLPLDWFPGHETLVIFILFYFISFIMFAFISQPTGGGLAAVLSDLAGRSFYCAISPVFFFPGSVWLDWLKLWCAVNSMARHACALLGCLWHHHHGTNPLS